MGVDTTTRLGITRWSAGGDPFTRIQMDDSHAALEAKTAIYAQGAFASRPAAGTIGRFYYATDTAVLYYDDGTAWRDIISANTVTLAGIQTLSNKTLSAPVITGTIALPGTTSIGSVTAAEIGYLAGVTSGIQSQIGSVSGVANAALPKAGGTMSGPIAMGSQKITGLANGTVTNDAVNFGQLDAVSTVANNALPKAGGTMSGTIAMGSQKITGLANGTSTNDAVNKGQLDALIPGSTSIVTVGTITTGTWSATTIADNKIASALTGKTYNGLTLTAASTGFTVAGGTTSKTLTVSNTLTLSGTDASTLNIGSGGTLGSAAFTASGAYAPSTGSGSITTVGTIGSGTWNATAIASNKIASALTGKTYNGITPTALTTGFSIAGGTTSKTLTVSNSLTLQGSDSATLNIGSGGTLGSAAYTASSAYAPAAGSSSIVTVGNISSGNWGGTIGSVSGANLTNLSAGQLSGTIPSAVLANSTVYIGTTGVALNRTSSALTLAGITLTTPNIGVAVATSINKVTITAPATSATLTLANGSTLATSGAYSTTLTATGTTTVTLPTSGTITTFKMFATNGSPGTGLGQQVGDVAIDYTNGKIYTWSA